MTTLSYGLRKAMGEEVSVAVCFSGSEALSLLGHQAFDVVISDYNMPGTSGLELLKRIRQEYGEMALVLITAYGTDVLEEGVCQLGGAYLTKPFEPSFLVQTIEGLIPGEETKGSSGSASHLMAKPGKPAGSSPTVDLTGLADPPDMPGCQHHFQDKTLNLVYMCGRISLKLLTKRGNAPKIMVLINLLRRTFQ